MKNTIKYIYIISITILFFSCEKEREWINSFPNIKTVKIENRDDTSATFVGEIESIGNDDIIEIGYIIKNKYYPYNYYFPIEVNDNVNSLGKYEAVVSKNLREGAKFKFIAYAKTNNHTVIGNEISYDCIENVYPEIISVEPISGTNSDKRTIIVKNMVEEYGIKVYAGSYLCNAEIISQNTIEITLSPYMVTGSYKVKYVNQGQDIYEQDLIITE